MIYNRDHWNALVQINIGVFIILRKILTTGLFISLSVVGLVTSFVLVGHSLFFASSSKRSFLRISSDTRLSRVFSPSASVTLIDTVVCWGWCFLDAPGSCSVAFTLQSGYSSPTETFDPLTCSFVCVFSTGVASTTISYNIWNE